MAAMKKQKNVLSATASISKNKSKDKRSPAKPRIKPYQRKEKPEDKPGTSNPASNEKKKRKFSTSGTPDKKKRRIDDKNTDETAGNKTGRFERKKKITVLDRKARKALAETRKRNRKPDFDLEKDVVLLWEKMRQRNLSSEERSRIVSTTLEKTKGKRLQMAKCRTTSRVLQACVKYCQDSERVEVFQELKPHFLELVSDPYGCHLAIKMLDHAGKERLRQLIGALHGHVVKLLRHPSGSAVVERAYQLASAFQKYELVSEFYAREFSLFKNVHDGNRLGIRDIYLAESPSKRKTIFQHMTLSLLPILEKQIVDHSIIHRALVEYLSIQTLKKHVQNIAEQLSAGDEQGHLLVRMIHTADGARIGISCVRYGTPKDRKKIVKGMKGQVVKVANDDHGYAVLLSIFDVVDDTDLVAKIIMSELAKEMKGICLSKYGQRLILHLLAPNTARYFPVHLPKLLECPIPTLPVTQAEDNSVPDSNNDKVNDDTAEGDAVKDDKDEEQMEEADGDKDEDLKQDDEAKHAFGDAPVSKKDPTVRRTELLKKTGFAEKLAETCAAHAKELLCSPIGKDVIYEVACGGVDDLTRATLTPEGITSVHKAIADLAALPKDESDDEHVMEQFHASRTIRRLLMDSRCHSKDKSFGEILYDTALKGRLRNWAQGHSLKVVTALRDSEDPKLERAKVEVQSLVLSGISLVSSDPPKRK